MATTVSIETTRDPTGVEIQVETKEAFDDFAPSGSARGWRKVQQDGKVTVMEESVQSIGSVSYSIETSCTQEPLETHPKFVGANTDEMRQYRLWQSNPNGVGGWSPSTSEDTIIQKLGSYRDLGITSYLCPRVVVKYTELSASPPSLTGIGLIGDPGISVGGVPNFLFMGASGQQEGAYWKNTYEYLGGQGGDSAPGWEPYIYGD